MNPQEMVEYFVRLARPRFTELLRLKIPHGFDPAPGNAGSMSLADNVEVLLKLTRTVQPYGDIHRFVTEAKVMGFVVNPGLVPLVKAISLELRGRRLLVTRRIAAAADDKGAVAHIDGIGIRVLMSEAPDQSETYLTWECLYGVA